VAGAVLIAVVTVSVVTQVHALKNRNVSRKIRVVSDTGQPIPAFFAGLPPVPAYLDGRI
jgi:hypothetical protein